MNTENNRHIDDADWQRSGRRCACRRGSAAACQLEDFRRRLGEMNKPAVIARRTLSRRVWFGVSAAAAAATAAAALIGWSPIAGRKPRRRGDRRHAAAVDSCERDRPEREDERILVFADQGHLRVARQGLDRVSRPSACASTMSYDLHDKVLYRVPEETRRGMEHFASMIASLRILLESKQPVDDPLKHLGFSEDNRAKAKVLKQEVEKVKAGWPRTGSIII